MPSSSLPTSPSTHLPLDAHLNPSHHHQQPSFQATLQSQPISMQCVNVMPLNQPRSNSTDKALFLWSRQSSHRRHLIQMVNHHLNSLILLRPNQPRLFLDLFAGHSAPLTVAARAANLDHFIPFDIEYDPTFNILDDQVLFNTSQKRRRSTSLEIATTHELSTWHYTLTTSTSSRISRIHRRISTRWSCRKRTTHQFPSLAGTFPPTIPLPMFMLFCFYSCLQVGI